MPNINTKFTLSGEKEYKQAISEIGSGMKVLDSEMRKVSSAYAQNADSVEALNAKNDVLARKIFTQAEKSNTSAPHCSSPPKNTARPTSAPCSGRQASITQRQN